MAYDVPEREPNELTIGDRWHWKVAYDDYLPADSWVLKYTFTRPGHRVVLTGSDNGDGYHKIQVLPATTATYDPGTYTWDARVSLSTEEYTVGRGVMTWHPEFDSDADGVDGRSHAKRVLDALEALIEGKATSDQISYSVGGRSLSRMSPEELWQWRARYRAEYRAELAEINRKLGRGSRRRVRVQFVS